MTTRYGINIRIQFWRPGKAKEVSVDDTWRQGLPRWSFRATQWLVVSLLALWALVLCWKGVSWAFHPHTFPILDELENLDWPLRVSYRSILHLFPVAIFADRPLGWAFERLLFERFGFDYEQRLAWFLSVHFLNCILVFALLRRLGTRLVLALAGVAAFGCLPCSAQTATYLSACFDALCTFFLLGSTLALLSQRRWQWVLSAVLYLLALRSKEWGIVIPIFLTALVIVRQAPGSTPRRLLIEVGKRLWAHYLIRLVFGACYLRLAAQIQTTIPAGSPYHVQPRLIPIYETLVYYTSFIMVGWNETPWRWVIFTALVLICLYALARRRGLILFGALAYVVTLLPVSMIPNVRSPFYAYGPQIFLILVVCLFLGDMVDLLWKRPAPRWLAGAFAAMLVLTGVSSVRASPSYLNGIRWTWMVRAASWRTAHDAYAQLSTIGPGAHVYVESGTEVPWLFAAGSSAFLQVWRNDYSIESIMGKPEAELRALYDRDNAEKYLLDYAPDGSFTTRLKAPRRDAPAAAR
jgi:hypothetical protein